MNKVTVLFDEHMILRFYFIMILIVNLYFQDMVQRYYGRVSRAWLLGFFRVTGIN